MNNVLLRCDKSMSQNKPFLSSSNIMSKPSNSNCNALNAVLGTSLMANWASNNTACCHMKHSKLTDNILKMHLYFNIPKAISYFEGVSVSVCRYRQPLFYDCVTCLCFNDTCQFTPVPKLHLSFSV